VSLPRLQRMLRIAILAGGSGTRFWPLGRASRPKQALALDGDDPRTLFEATLDRVAPLADAPPWVIAPASLEKVLKGAAGGHRYEFLPEPAPRNTAAAVAIAALEGLRVDFETVVLVVPADHHVAPLAKYRAALRAMAAQARTGDSIVTLGLAPTRPATGYGWLKVGARLSGSRALPVHRVERYVEKPPLARAKKMLADGKHLWNGGTFAFRPLAFLEPLTAHLPGVAQPLLAAYAKRRTHYAKRGLARAYAGMPSVSVDHGVMEKAKDVVTVAASLDWDDLGSWDAVARHRRTDRAGNRVRGAVTLVDAQDCVVDAADGHVALLGVEDLIVVRTKDTVLVARRGSGERVREMVARLESEARRDLVR
jgi:mannose-1-phosphate guanylyltransferase